MRKSFQQSLTRARDLIRGCLCIAAVVWLVDACAVADNELLNSERIEHKYGSYGVEIVAQDPSRRLSSLYSGTPADSVTRTLALVEFYTPVDPALIQQHLRILAGASIGASLKNDGWQLRKRSLAVEELIAGPEQRWLSLKMRLSPPKRLAMHIYELSASKDGTTALYARISEVHHSDYLNVDTLREIYRTPSAAPPASAVITPAQVTKALDEAFAQSHFETEKTS